MWRVPAEYLVAPHRAHTGGGSASRRAQARVSRPACGRILTSCSGGTTFTASSNADSTTLSPRGIIDSTISTCPRFTAVLSSDPLLLPLSLSLPLPPCAARARRLECNFLPEGGAAPTPSESRAATRHTPHAATYACGQPCGVHERLLPASRSGLVRVACDCAAPRATAWATGGSP